MCVCACLPVFICVLVDLFCPPPTTTATVLPIPHPIYTSSPCFAKCVSSGNVCGNVHKTASVGLAWAKKHSISTPPHARTIPFPSPTTRVLFLSDSVEGRRNFAHVTIHWRMKHRPGGRNMIPTCAWPILILRGVSQPTPNAPEVPRTAGVCLDISNAHVPRYFHIFISSALRIFVKTLYKSKFGPEGMFTNDYMST